jgi:hypothetical protein
MELEEISQLNHCQLDLFKNEGGETTGGLKSSNLPQRAIMVPRRPDIGHHPEPKYDPGGPMPGF